MSNNAPIIVRAHTLGRLIDFTTTYDPKGFLAGIRIEPHDDGGIAVASNSKSLGAIMDRGALVSSSVTVQIEARALKRALRGNITPNHYAVIDRTSDTNGTVKITYARDAQAACEKQAIETLQAKLIDEWMKDWRRMFRNADLQNGATLDRKLLITAIRAIDKRSADVTVRENGPSTFIRSENDDFVAMLGPKLNVDADNRGVPGWLS